MVKGRWQQVQDLDIPDNGLKVFLKDFGKVMLFRTMLKDQRRHYVVYLPEEVPFARHYRMAFQKNAVKSIRQKEVGG